MIFESPFDKTKIEILDCSQIEILENIQAKTLSTYCGGGIIEKLVIPKSIPEFVFAMTDEGKDMFGLSNIRLDIIAQGSNTLIPDGLNLGTAICTKHLKGVEINENYAKVVAGQSFTQLIKVLQQENLGGLEFLAGIPCSVGGAVFMNAGAFGGQTFDYVESIIAFDNSLNRLVRLSKSDIDFGYRKGFKGIIVEVVFKLHEKDRDISIKEVNEFLTQRKIRQPQKPSLGSVFKNPKGMSAGQLIEQTGLKGCKLGGAEVSKLHANFIVNTGNGNATDYHSLANFVKMSVYEKFGIKLEKEYRVLFEK